MRKVAEGRITHSFQITIKKEARKVLNVAIGDLLIFYENGDGSLIMKKGEVVEAQPECASS